jgi:CDP-glycerol glycerophosphotransferase
VTPAMCWPFRDCRDAPRSEQPSAFAEAIPPEQPRRCSDALISVVVPCYNVAPYLDECLESVTGQTHANLEIIAIDDGSTDGSGALLEEWATRDRRISVITQANAGLGAARNRGVDGATGEFMTFVDSDDKLPVDALATMVASAEATGSDFVTGVVRRFEGDKTWKVSLHRRIFTKYTPATHIYERPSLVRDHIVCGKLFRRDFWIRESLRFPEAVLFEDIEVATRAHCVARSVDIVPEPIYFWRRRPSGDLSITQDRTRPGGVTGRFCALAAVNDFLRDNAPEQVWIRHGRKVFEADLPLYTKLFEDADDRFRAEMLEASGPLMESLSPSAVGAQGELHQCLYRHLVTGNEQGVLAMVRLTSSPRTAARVISGFRLLPMRDRLELARVGVRQVSRSVWKPVVKRFQFNR